MIALIVLTGCSKNLPISVPFTDADRDIGCGIKFFVNGVDTFPAEVPQVYPVIYDNMSVTYHIITEGSKEYAIEKRCPAKPVEVYK